MGKMLKTEYTRLPLFDGDINNIIGIFHMRKANHLVRSGAGDSQGDQAFFRRALLYS